MEDALSSILNRVPTTKSELPPVVTNTPRAGEVNDPRKVPYTPNVPGYEQLTRILLLAYKQAAEGKGKERHSKQAIGFRPWDQQPILQIGRMCGTGYQSGQVQKKVQEAVTMAGNGNFSGAKAEVLGVIVYAAALHKLLEEIEDDQLTI